jgi:DNA mismatch endonuclease, patch repair protein
LDTESCRIAGTFGSSTVGLANCQRIEGHREPPALSHSREAFPRVYDSIACEFNYLSRNAARFLLVTVYGLYNSVVYPRGAIGGRGNKDTELALMKLLRRHCITGWRRNQPLFGKPDFIFRKVRLALFVDGCFWHGCPKHSHWPNSNRLFWRNKFLRNKIRDRFVTRTLREQGWRVLRIWEHELGHKSENWIVRRIQRALL